MIRQNIDNMRYLRTILLSLTLMMTLVASAQVFKVLSFRLVANDISKKDSGFSSDFNEVFVLDKNLNIIKIDRDTKDNIAEKLQHCDGAFVGTGFKVDGKFENHTEYERVRKFMSIVKASR